MLLIKISGCHDHQLRHLKPIQMYSLVYTCVQAGGCNVLFFGFFSYVCGKDCRIFCAYKCAN